MQSSQVILALGLPIAAGLTCRPEGPVLPKPTSLSSSPSFRSAASDVTEIFESVINGTTNVPWAVSNTSFSVAVVSLDQKDPGIPIWEYHHLSPQNVNGTKHINRDSQYLIGSISKAITDYAMLQSGIDIDAPVTQYLPLLSNGDPRIAWNNITLRMLGSHLAGVPANYGFSEYYFIKEVFESQGFPSLPKSDYPTCGVIGLNGACSADDLLRGLTKSYPVAAPMEHPQYSNIAFTIIALAMEAATGKNYTEVIDTLVSKPLGLTRTRPSPGIDKEAVIPPGENSWGSDYGLNAPGGGLVSSTADLSRFAHSLLSRSALSPSKTRQWLKPATFVGSSVDTVGMPWEIFRSPNITPDHPHPVTLFSKAGEAMAYRSQLSMVDEYGVALIVMTAGDMFAQPDLTNLIISKFIPAVDKDSRLQAKVQYERTFKSANGSVEITFCQDRDSLKVCSFHRDKFDLLKGWTNIWSMTVGQYGIPFSNTVRVFPSELSQRAHMDGKQVNRDMWRLWPELKPPPQGSLPGSEIFKGTCFSWAVGDWVHYGSEPLDRIVFYRDSHGEVVGVELPFLRSGVMRPKDCA